MRRLLLLVLTALACHEHPRQTTPTRRADEDGAARREAVHPLEPAGAGEDFEGPVERCDGPVYLRVRNASTEDFDSAELDGIPFGPVQVGAVSEYKQVPPGACVYWYGAMSVRSGARRFAIWPMDFMGETPLKPGHYTQALTTEPSGDAQTPGGIRNKIARDPEPK